MSHYGPKWQVISNLSLTPVWTRIREPSMKADTPIFEFVICNWGEGGETVYYGLQQVMRDFSTDHGYIFVHQMDNYESRKFVKNREKKILNYRLMIVYIYRVGIKFSRFLIFTREKYIFSNENTIYRTYDHRHSQSVTNVDFVASLPPFLPKVCSHP